jgi:predicted HD phosphohydrolase
MKGRAEFKSLTDATAQDFQIIKKYVTEYQTHLSDRLFSFLHQLGSVHFGYSVTQEHHCLEMATRAYRDNANDETVFAALFHDIGKIISTVNHAPAGAEILRPYVSDQTYNILYYHQEFQGAYYFHLIGMDPEACQKYKNEKWYKDACYFASLDQASFDPNYKCLSKDDFKDLVKTIVDRQKSLRVETK